MQESSMPEIGSKESICHSGWEMTPRNFDPIDSRLIPMNRGKWHDNVPSPVVPRVPDLVTGIGH
jgi:hypothetical protein